MPLELINQGLAIAILIGLYLSGVRLTTWAAPLVERYVYASIDNPRDMKKSLDKIHDELIEIRLLLSRREPGQGLERAVGEDR